MTLLELLVAITVLGIVASVAVAHVAPPSAAATDERTAARLRLRDARLASSRSSRPVTITLALEGHVHEMTAMPDGSVIGGEPLGLERLGGGDSAAAGARGR